jgi:ribulose-5-phosphate 4-epimerase/fuculose-1-phosphate aldolase
VIDPTILDEVVDANLALAAAGQSDLIWGHVSLRSPRADGLLMKAAGWGFEEITPERIVLVSPTGDVLEGSGPRHIEFHIHAAILDARPEVMAVVHTHSEPAATFASLDVPLRALSHDAAPFLEPELPRFTRSGDLIRTREMGEHLAVALGSANGILIPGHGLVTVGTSLARAVMHAATLDRACRLQLAAMAAGGPARWCPPDEVVSKQGMWNSGQLEAGYAYLVRKGRR